MPVRYTMTPCPTRFQGCLYRSRLEARWAAFFTRCRWRFTYEPFDLGAWSPDFLLHSRFPQSPSVLVEVKPIEHIDAETCARMERARPATPNYELLLLGLSPADDKTIPSELLLGWSKAFPGDDEWRPEDLPTPWFERSAVGLMLGRGLGDEDPFGEPAPWPSWDVWRAACNDVQWHRVS